MTVTTYDSGRLTEEMNRVFKNQLATATLCLRFSSDYVGGQPANKKSVEAFVEHHLGLSGISAEQAASRILGEEVRLDSDTDEVPEKASYGLNVIRRTKENVAYLGTWQMRAMIKQAASRLGLFAAKGKIGSKGDLSEAMLIRPAGPSCLGGSQQICFIVDGDPYDQRAYRQISGSVNSPKGRTSIQHDSEFAPAGCELHATIEWPTKKIKPDDMAAILALGQRVGLGSVKAMEFGRFDIVGLEIKTLDGKKA